MLNSSATSCRTVGIFKVLYTRNTMIPFQMCTVSQSFNISHGARPRNDATEKDGRLTKKKKKTRWKKKRNQKRGSRLTVAEPVVREDKVVLFYPCSAERSQNRCRWLCYGKIAEGAFGFGWEACDTRDSSSAAFPVGQ